MASVTTRVFGYLYKSDGTKITTGKLLISLLNDFISIDGYKIAPFRKNVTLAETTGLVDVDLVATVNSLGGSAYGQPYPLGVVYQFEFDPTPSDSTIAINRKDGYWKALYAIPHISDTDASNEIGIGALIPATSSSTTASATYVLSTDTRMLTQEDKDTLTDGSNADALHSHTTVSEDVITLGAIEEPGTPSAGFMNVYVTASGTTPNRQITTWGKFENASAFILATAIV